MDEYAVDRVLLAVEQIPPGRVAAYGDIGRIAGTGPRHVGTILRRFGASVPWWRVVSADGDPGGRLVAQARPHWAEEGIAVKPNGLGCRIAEHRADLAAVEAAYRAALAAIIARSGTALPRVGGPATAGLAQLGITRLEHVLEWSEAELLAQHAVGAKAVRMLGDELARLGWAWRRRHRPAG